MESSRQIETASIPHNENDADDSSGVGAGTARTLARQTRYIKILIVQAEAALARWVSRADIGRFPRKVPAKSVGRLSDNLATAKDLYDSWQEGATKQQQQQRQQHHHEIQLAQRRFVTGARFGNVSRRFALATMHRFPPFAKSFLLGTALFSAYEAVDEKLTTTITPEAQRDADVWHGFAQFSIAALAGTSAGACHGVLSFLYESIIERRSLALGGSNVGARFGGTLVAHSLAHGTLFGTYELVKHSALDTTGTNHSRWGGVAVVAAAGAVAGVAQEAVSYYAMRMERYGIRRGLRAARRVQLPDLHRLFSSAPSSAVGFLAFEFSRLVVTEIVRDVDNEAVSAKEAI